jgi:hypothetical protein
VPHSSNSSFSFVVVCVFCLLFFIFGASGLELFLVFLLHFNSISSEVAVGVFSYGQDRTIRERNG